MNGMNVNGMPASEQTDDGNIGQDNNGQDNTSPRSTDRARTLGARFRSVGKLLAAIVVAASFAVWIYAYSGLAARDAPDLLDDSSFATSGEAICATTLDDLAQLPEALDAVDGPDRARQIRTSTDRLGRMISDLEAAVGGTDRDIQIATGWLTDWRVLIGDRYRYADAIEADENAQFLVTDTGVGERLDRRITRFATTNTMLSCVAPTDVG
jgi:hypothetical protein